MKGSFYIIFLCLMAGSVYGQLQHPELGEVFRDDEVPRIDINIDENSLQAIFENVYSDDEYEAQFVFTSSTLKDTVDNIGFRLRGNTSRGADKKSYKISFNTFKPGRKFHGLEKMNINGEHNDPSIVRSKMCWDIYADAGVPATRTNHVALYINEIYYGLYTNVEHVDEQFVKKRFNDGTGNLWKCLYPATLEYLGFDSELYKEGMPGFRTYDLKTNKDQDNYGKLAHFIDVINNYQGEDLKCELERIFDIDNYLKIIALDVLTGNWDGYIPNKNNFYLYHNPCTDKINFISYDLDNTIGIDWFGTDWATSDMYDWSSYGFGNDERPLYDRIMDVPEYRARYSHYMTQIIMKQFNADLLDEYLDNKLELVKSFRENDPAAGLDYGWSYLDFIDSYEVSIGDHVKKGMKEYIEDRVQNISDQIEDNDIVPFIRDVMIDWNEDEVRFDIDAHDDGVIQQITFHYSFDQVEWIEESLMVDMEGNASYFHQVDEEGILYYYIVIVDDQNQSRQFPLCGSASERLGYLPTPALVINEIVASNGSIKKDEYDEYEDWIELFNASGTVLPIDKYFLTDDPGNPSKWLLPNTALNPNQYLVIWADDDTHQGSRHANFKLKKSGEYVGLYDSKDNHHALIEEITYPALDTDQSYARQPNATGEFNFESYPTFGYNNDLASSLDEEKFTSLKLFPNPGSGIINIETDIALNNFHLICIDMLGYQFSLEANGQMFSVEHLPEGIYTLLLQNENIIHAKKFTILK